MILGIVAIIGPRAYKMGGGGGGGGGEWVCLSGACTSSALITFWKAP